MNSGTHHAKEFIKAIMKSTSSGIYLSRFVSESLTNSLPTQANWFVLKFHFFMRLFFYLRVKMTKFYIRVRKMIWLCKCLINRQFFSHDKYLFLGNKLNVNQNVISSWGFFSMKINI